jgi:hypothetical protein
MLHQLIAKDDIYPEVKPGLQECTKKNKTNKTQSNAAENVIG